MDKIKIREFKRIIAEVFDEKFKQIVLNAPEAQYLNYQEVCKITHLTRATVYKYVEAGELKVCKIGSKRLFKLLDVTNFIEKQRS